MCSENERARQGASQDAGLRSAGPLPCLTVPSLLDLFLSFLRLGSVSFGGPGMVAYIRRLAVERRRWVSEQDFQQGVALCQAVPGATAMQCAAYVGLRARGVLGAVASYLGFGLPAFALMLSLSAAYRHALSIHAVSGALVGLRCLVVALVANAAWAFGRSSVTALEHGVIAGVTAGLFLVGGSPFLIVVGTGLTGAILLRGPQPRPETGLVQTPGWGALRAPAVALAVAAVLVATLLAFSGGLEALGLAMMKVDLFAFGGGFASVPLMYHEVVEKHAWMRPAVFMDGIALGQVTPGPIVITATFVGYQVARLTGAVVSTVCVFLPSFLIVLLAEPWFRRFRSSPVFGAAVQGLLLSFVGLLASVTVQFARVAPWSVPSGIIAAIALVALVRKVDVLWVVLAGAAASAALVPLMPK